MPKILLRRLPDAWRPPDLDVCKGSEVDIVAPPRHRQLMSQYRKCNPGPSCSAPTHQCPLKNGSSAALHDAERDCPTRYRFVTRGKGIPLSRRDDGGGDDNSPPSGGATFGRPCRSARFRPGLPQQLVGQHWYVYFVVTSSSVLSRSRSRISPINSSSR